MPPRKVLDPRVGAINCQDKLTLPHEEYAIILFGAHVINFRVATYVGGSIARRIISACKVLIVNKFLLNCINEVR